MKIEAPAYKPPTVDSCKDTFMGENVYVEPMKEEILDEEEIEIIDGDVMGSMIDVIISIKFLDTMQALAKKSLDQIVVNKLLGRRIV
ncbi:hypothetical protein V6N12_074898 [Hibiscus sabdariffa]|uniref:Uncharacterized protein n=1 Tax=Hibiscus sabdariffa TaxID=183260 RepID=A0ABR2D2Q9_9ROSI